MNDLPTGPIVPRPAPQGAFDTVMARARHRRRVRVLTVSGVAVAVLVLVAIPAVLARIDTPGRTVHVGLTSGDSNVRNSTASSSATSTTATTIVAPTSTTTTTLPAVPPLGTVEVGGGSLREDELALIRQVHEALGANDQGALDRLLDTELDPATRAERLNYLSDPNFRAAALLALSAHPASTDGFTYPGFMLGCFDTPFAAEDGRRLGIDVPADAGTFDTRYCDLQQQYRGVLVLFDLNVGTDRGLTWTGALPYQPVASQDFVFPDTTLEQAREAQASVDEGHQPWRVDPTQVASSYALSLGWANTTVTPVETNVYDITTTDNPQRLRLTMSQPIRQDQTGIWEIVTATAV